MHVVDGYKRLGWLATAVFLEINVEISNAENDAVEELVIEIAATRIGIDEIATPLRALIA